jgi:hypothetical protein
MIFSNSYLQEYKNNINQTKVILGKKRRRKTVGAHKLILIYLLILEVY